MEIKNKRKQIFKEYYDDRMSFEDQINKDLKENPEWSIHSFQVIHIHNDSHQGFAVFCFVVYNISETIEWNTKKDDYIYTNDDVDNIIVTNRNIWSE